MPRPERDGHHVTASDVLDLLRIDGGQLTVAELLGERALAAAEIAGLRAQVALPTQGEQGRPDSCDRARRTNHEPGPLRPDIHRRRSLRRGPRHSCRVRSYG